MRDHIALMGNKLGTQQVVVVASLPRLLVRANWRSKWLYVIVANGH
jgi:hypothetical protein